MARRWIWAPLLAAGLAAWALWLGSPLARAAAGVVAGDGAGCGGAGVVFSYRDMRANK